MVDVLVVGLSGIEFCIGVASIFLAWTAWQYRHDRVGRPIVVMALGTSAYSFSTALLSFVTDPLWWLFVNNVGYPLGAVLAITSFYAVVEFTDREWPRHPAIAAAFVTFVLLDTIVSFTDPLHRLMITSLTTVAGVVVGTHGPLFYIHAIVSLGLVAVAILLLLLDFSETSGIYRKQLTAFLVAFLVAMIGFAVQTFAPVHPAIDVATIGLFGWTAIMFWGVFRADFFDLVPIGRRWVVRGMDDPVITLDADNRVIDSNPAARALAGVEHDWEATPVETFFETHPSLVRAIESEEPQEVELDDGGDTRYVTLNISPIRKEAVTVGRQQQSRIGSVVVMRDITAQISRQHELQRTNEQLERRNDQLDRARKRYQALFEHSPLALWEQDLSETMKRAEQLAADADDLATYLATHPNDHRRLLEAVDIIDVNENAVEAYGASSKAELIDNFEALFTDEARETNRQLLQRLLGGGQRFSDETVYRTLDGERRHVLLNVFVPEADDYSRVIVAGADITDRKEYEAKIERQNRRLERLARVISHDLQTPLSTAEKHLQLLEIELTDPDEPVATSLSDLEVTHERLRRFAEHLPRLARESTDVESPVECSIADVAEDAWAVTETGDLELVLEAERPIEADPRRLQQVFENLFSNIAEHATDGESAATTVWVDADEASFSVADDGPGVSGTQREEIFEYGMSSGSGSGIGLAIVRSIIEAHGWTISVSESKAGGAKFVVRTVTSRDGVDRGA